MSFFLRTKTLCVCAYKNNFRFEFLNWKFVSSFCAPKIHFHTSKHFFILFFYLTSPIFLPHSRSLSPSHSHSQFTSQVMTAPSSQLLNISLLFFLLNSEFSSALNESTTYKAREKKQHIVLNVKKCALCGVLR